MRGFTDPFKAQRRQVELEQRAWGHRRVLTPSEAVLWEALRRCALGVQFRRQVPLGGRYIADFLAPRVRLIVEVDGGYHVTRRSADARRDRDLARLGYRTLRVPAELVMAALPVALELVLEALAECLRQATVPERGSNRLRRHPGD